MAESFNLNNFLQTYKTQTYDPTKQHAKAEAKMEAKLVEDARIATAENPFLSFTLKEKLTELGIGDKVIEQLKETAGKLFTGFTEPWDKYMKKYKIVFDPDAYNTEIQAYAKQMFFASQAMAEEAGEHKEGQNFVYQM